MMLLPTSTGFNKHNINMNIFYLHNVSANSNYRFAQQHKLIYRSNGKSVRLSVS